MSKLSTTQLYSENFKTNHNANKKIHNSSRTVLLFYIQPGWTVCKRILYSEFSRAIFLSSRETSAINQKFPILMTQFHGQPCCVYDWLLFGYEPTSISGSLLFLSSPANWNTLAIEIPVELRHGMGFGINLQRFLSSRRFYLVK